jgi:hypothetical protein
MAAVMIGVDPHKGSHTAVAIGLAEEPLGELRVRSSASGLPRVFRTGELVLFNAASCRFRYSSWTSCGVL